MNFSERMNALFDSTAARARALTVALSLAALTMMWAIGLPQLVANSGGTGSEKSWCVLILLIVLTAAVALCLFVCGTSWQTFALSGVMFNVAAFPVLVILAQEVIRRN